LPVKSSVFIVAVSLLQTVSWLCRMTVKYMFLATDISREIIRFWIVCYRTLHSVARNMSGISTFPFYSINVKLPLYTTRKRAWNVGIAPFIPNWTRSECAVSRFCRFIPGMSHDSSVSIERAAPTTLSCVDRTLSEIEPSTSQNKPRTSPLFKLVHF
jgi:hypothetical protein